MKINRELTLAWKEENFSSWILNREIEKCVYLAFDGFVQKGIIAALLEINRDLSLASKIFLRRWLNLYILIRGGNVCVEKGKKIAVLL